MPKCSQCRKLESMDTYWDKFRYFFFNFFHKDIIDLSQDKFTQGFGDGYTMGRKHQKEESDKELGHLHDLFSDPVKEAKFPAIVELEKVLTTNKQGHVFLNGVLIESKKLEQLKGEAIMFGNSLLWEIITNTLLHRAQVIGWNESKELQDLFNAKTIGYTIDVQTNILKKIELAI